MSFVVDESQINPHQQPAAIIKRMKATDSEEVANLRDVQKQVRAKLRETVEWIRRLKALRAAPGQPGWRDSDFGLQLEQRKGLATLLCVSRSRTRSRYHSVILPRTILLPPRAGQLIGRRCRVAARADLHRLADEEIAARFGAAGPPEIG